VFLAVTTPLTFWGLFNSLWNRTSSSYVALADFVIHIVKMLRS
jgi:hypothetical protein